MHYCRQCGKPAIKFAPGHLCFECAGGGGNAVDVCACCKMSPTFKTDRCRECVRLDCPAIGDCRRQLKFDLQLFAKNDAEFSADTYKRSALGELEEQDSDNYAARAIAFALLAINDNLEFLNGALVTIEEKLPTKRERKTSSSRGPRRLQYSLTDKGEAFVNGDRRCLNCEIPAALHSGLQSCNGGAAVLK